MNLVDRLTALLKDRQTEMTDQAAPTPEGLCPNCWGSQEYAGLIRELEHDFQVEVNRGTGKYDFIKEFVVKHLDGIRLKNTVHGLECAKCRVK